MSCLDSLIDHFAARKGESGSDDIECQAKSATPPLVASVAFVECEAKRHHLFQLASSLTSHIRLLSSLPLS